MKTVRISQKTARGLHDFVAAMDLARRGPVGSERQLKCVDLARWSSELERALRPSPKRQQAQRSRRVAKASKQETKHEATARVRAAALLRSRGRCESCTGHPAHLTELEMDHFFGRGRAESLWACWMLCRHCHAGKTRNRPSAAHWLTAFVAHCERHGYSAAAERSRRRLEGIVSVRARQASGGGQ